VIVCDAHPKSSFLILDLNDLDGFNAYITTPLKEMLSIANEFCVRAIYNCEMKLIIFRLILR
jgi:hypothetical protein